MTSHRPAAVIVLAAGEGTRMVSRTPKVLHRIGGRTLLGHALAAARGVDPERLVVVVRTLRDAVAEAVIAIDPRADVAEQDDVPGTGRAAECGLAALPDDLEGIALVIMGDAPLLTTQTLQTLIESHRSGAAAATVLTARLGDPTGYGRVVRTDQGAISAIVEHRDATPEQTSITEVNAGCYAFEIGALRAGLAEVGRANVQREKYLPDVLAVLIAAGRSVQAHETADVWQTEGVNDRAQLARLGGELNRRILNAWMLAGVTVVDPGSTWVDCDVTLAPDVTLYPNTQLQGTTKVEGGAAIGPDTTLSDVSVGHGATIVRTHASGAVIGEGAMVGPYAAIRPKTVLGARGKIGTFVETKNAEIADGAKVPHLSYVGDADIGAGSNIGAGTIFANYDGENKHHTSVGAECHTGANNTFVAPVIMGDGASTGAGTVVRRNVPAGALAVSTGAQRAILDWVHRKRPGSKAARAAAAAAVAAETASGEDL